MATRKNHLRIVARSHKPPPGGAAPPPTVSARWLLSAVAIALLASGLCAWGTLCLLFWQGSWQLLYHPKAAITRTPSTAGVVFEPVAFAVTEAGQQRIQGWWIAGDSTSSLSRLTILYLHGATGNLSDSVDMLARLHSLGPNILAFDYRGYGISEAGHPSEARWLEDAGWAMDYLTKTRRIDPRTIVVAGSELGADLAVEIAAAHPELAGLIVESPIESPANIIFNDSRAHLVPAHLLVSDRWDMDGAAAQLHVPSIWLLASTAVTNAGVPTALDKVKAPYELVRLKSGQNALNMGADAIAAWLQKLNAR